MPGGLVGRPGPSWGDQVTAGSGSVAPRGFLWGVGWLHGILPSVAGIAMRVSSVFPSPVVLLPRIPMKTSFVALILMLLTACNGLAQKSADTTMGDKMIEKYLAEQAELISQKVFDGAKSREEWESKRPRLRQEYLDMLGLWPLPEKTPLKATVTGTVERDKEGVLIEKLHFQSKPGLYVTGNLYRPKMSSGKLPAVLYVCGHSGRGRDGNKTAFQDHGVWFASNGYVCLIIDTLQLGEIPGIHHGTYREGRWWWQARGYTPAGVECWNGVRAIDYLVSRPDVDAERIAVTGISGGGAATFWIAAADERVKCAVPVSGMSDLQSYVTNKVVNGHCDCMFLINTYQWEWTTIAALVAPRPMLFANSDKDSIFPMDGNRRILARLQKLYQFYGHPELIDEYISKGGHEDRLDLRVAAFQWINKHLKGDARLVNHTEFKPLPGTELRVFADELPNDALNGKIDETFVAKAEAKLPEEGKFEEWKKGLIVPLRGQLFRVKSSAEIKLERGRSQGLENKADRAVLIVLNNDEDSEMLPEWAKPFVCADDPAVFAVPRGTGSLTWTHKSPPNYVERAHALLGQSVDERRFHDVILAFQLSQSHATHWRVLGRGQGGILAAYAALFEPAIEEVIAVDPPASHRQGPNFLNVLRILDIPEALGMLAPRPLTLVNANDPAFDRTVEIYKRAGAEEKLRRK